MSDDAVLLRQFAADRSETAFRELLRRHLPYVYSAARRLLNGDSHAAEDVSQRVFFDLANRAAALKKTAVLSNWLHCRTRSLAKNLVRTNARRRHRESEAASRWMDENGTGDHWARLSPLLDEALGDLSRADREVLLLRYYEKRDLRSVGRSLGISDDTAQKRVCRALDRLKGILMSRGLALNATVVAGCLADYAAAGVPEGLETRVGSTIQAPAAAGGRHRGLAAHAKACGLGLAAACAAGGILTWWPAASPARAARGRQGDAVPPLAKAAGDDAREEKLRTGAQPDEIIARMRHLATMPETGRNREAFNALLDLISAQDWPDVAAKIHATGHGELWSRCLPGMMRRWGDIDPRAALVFCAAHTTGIPGEREFRNAFLAWHPKDPAAALDGMSAAFKDLSRKSGYAPFDGVSLSRLCLPLLKLQPDKLDAFVENTADIKAYDGAGATVKEWLVYDLTASWPELPPERFLKWWPALTDANRAGGAASNLIVTSLTNKSGDAPGVGALADQLIQSNETVRGAVAARVAVTWSHYDAPGAAVWMKEALTAGERDEAAKMLARDAVRDARAATPDTRQMAAAMNWAAAISEPATRERTLGDLYHAWKRADAAGADSFLQNTGWPAEQTARMQSGGQNPGHP